MQKAIRFFKAYSDLGIYSYPHKASESNRGVRWGADAILTSTFLASLPYNQTIEELHYQFPAEINSDDYVQVIHDDAVKNAKSMQNTKEDELRIVVGGDHSVAFASLMATVDLEKGKRIGYIHCDSHADMNKWSTSPSGNFHGMFLRPFFDTFDNSLIDRLVPDKISKEHLCYIGNLVTDENEEQFIREHNIQVIHTNCAKSKERLLSFIRDKDFLHISFDIDVFDSAVAPATGTPNPNGLSRECVFELLTILKDFKQKSIDIVEVNPEKPGAEKTALLAQEVIVALI